MSSLGTRRWLQNHPGGSAADAERAANSEANRRAGEASWRRYAGWKGQQGWGERSIKASKVHRDAGSLRTAENIPD